MSELQQQAEHLQQRLNASNQPDVVSVQTWAPVGAFASSELASVSAPVATFTSDAATGPISYSPISRVQESMQVTQNHPPEFQAVPTLPRTIGGHTVSSREVDEVFQV